jgi:MFS transporter
MTRGAPPVPATAMRSAARIPRLRSLLGAYAVNGLGDWLGEIALSLVLLRLTGSVLAVTALWLLGRFAPALVAPALVARLRRSPRASAALPLLLAGEGLLFALTAAAWPVMPPTVILAIALADGVLALAARSLLKAAAATASRPAGLQREAVQAIITMFALTTTIGPLLGGIVTSTLGPSMALAVDAASFAAASALVRNPGGAATNDSLDPESSVRRALAHLRGHALLARLCLIEGIAAAAFSMILPIEVAYVTQTLGGSATEAGLVLGAWGLGAVAGSGCLRALRRAPLPLLLCAALAVMAISYAGMGVAVGIPMVACFSLLGGLGNGIEPFAFTACVQEHTPVALQAEVTAVIEALQTAAPGIGFVAGGALATLASPRAAYLVAAVGVVVLVAALGRELVASRSGRGLRPVTV